MGRTLLTAFNSATMRPQRIQPGPGQESVWDYPRPPALEATPKQVRVVCDDVVIASTVRSQRVLETSHPPVYYIPPEDVRMDLLRRTRGGSFCEWKGRADYFALVLPTRVIDQVAWAYPNPTSRFAEIASFLAFYPSKCDACFVDDQRVQAQAGDFYGGWITSEIVGPFKGAAGTNGW